MSTDVPEWKRGREKFVKDVANHRMRVLMDDGLYRHLRFAQPEHSWHYWFELVTWPGALTIRGDMGSWTFSRVEDMFTFFSSGSGINPSYWAEKICGDGRDTAHRHDEDRVRRYVAEQLEDRINSYSEEDQRAIRDALEEEVLGAVATDATATYTALTDFNECGFQFTDIWDVDFKDWTTQFLWCCHAIRWGIDRYREYATGNTELVKPVGGRQ